MQLDVRSDAAASRTAAVLFTLCALLASIELIQPVQEPRLRLGIVAIASALTALLCVRAPWSRWSPRATLWIVPLAIAIIGVSSTGDLVPIRSYGVFFVLVFAWIGLYHPRWTSLRFIPLAIVGYAAPLILTHADPPLSPRALFVNMVACALVAETVAFGREVADLATLRADRAGVAFRRVAMAGARLGTLEPDQVLDAVVDCVIELGYDGASISIIDAETNTFEATHPRGIAAGLAGARLDASLGVTGAVRSRGETVAFVDYPSTAGSIAAAVTDGSVQSAVGAPIFVGGSLVGVLGASTATRFEPTVDELKALELLAELAGTAIAGAEALDRARAAAVIDPLTGVGNRGSAVAALARVVPGDALVLIDVDHFRSVNERLGHAGGDGVLVDLARHLQAGVRGGDSVARYGGEEFLLVLPRCPESEAYSVVQRLLDTWATPVTTFSAGIAVHAGDRTVDATLEAADKALYDAKHRGRNRVHTA